MGFIQFISPTLQFIIGVASGEALPGLSLLAFAFIWSGVAVYAVTAWHKTRGIAAPSVRFADSSPRGGAS